MIESANIRPQAAAPGLSRGTTPTGSRIRTLVVDDSVVMRRLITRMLTADPAIELVGSARDGRDALEKVAQWQPELVTLDVEMPEMNGLEALKILKSKHPAVRVIMCSSLTQRGASETIEALLSGASDYVTKQHSSELGEDAYESLRIALLGKIRSLFADRLACSSWKSPVAPAHTPLEPAAAEAGVRPPMAPAVSRTSHIGSAASPLAWRPAPKILVIGSSTGGPAALAEILPLLPSDFPLPIAIVQHMPPLFTQLLAERLSRASRIEVVEAGAGMVLRPGLALLAPGDFHMRLVRRAGGVEVELNRQHQENSCRPAVDVLFRSAAEVYGAAALAVVLTGMGQDGLVGVRTMKALGASALVQDSSTSVVWGMPGAIAEAQLADAVLPLSQIVPEVLRRL